MAVDKQPGGTASKVKKSKAAKAGTSEGEILKSTPAEGKRRHLSGAQD